ISASLQMPEERRHTLVRRRHDRQAIGPALTVAPFDCCNRISRFTSSHFQHCHALTLLICIRVMPQPKSPSSMAEPPHCQAPCHVWTMTASPPPPPLVPWAVNTQQVSHTANEPGKPGSTPPNWRGNCRAQHLALLRQECQGFIVPDHFPTHLRNHPANSLKKTRFVWLRHGSMIREGL